MAADIVVNAWTLAAGAVGAVVAMYVKEGVQTALQRQILIGQLDAYVKQWQARITRQTEYYMIYSAVEKREQALMASLANGRKSFNEQFEKNRIEREGLLAKIETAAHEQLDKLAASKSREALHELLNEIAAAQVTQRQYLMDGKNFVSDRDAAVLGKEFATHIVTFRTSLLQTFLAIEGIARLSKLNLQTEEDAQRHRTMLVNVVKGLVLDGESVLVSLVRLQWHLNASARKNLLVRTWDVLRGA